MSTELIQHHAPIAPAMSVRDIIARAEVIRDVMKKAMKNNVHYGKIPNTQKPSLWQPGAELLTMMFQISVGTEIDADLSAPDVVRYRIRATATNAAGAFLGSAIGECSSDEEKYKWRKPACPAEFDAVPTDWKRLKWKSDGSILQQIRTEPADIGNTVLMMATKRAYVKVVRQVTGASDVFTQDEVPEASGETREQSGNSEGAPKAANAITEGQAKRAWAIGKEKGFSPDQYRAFLQNHGFETDRAITKDKYEAIIGELQKGPQQ